MTPDELHALLGQLNWSLGDLAHFGHRNRSRVLKMGRGKEPVDQPLADWLRVVAAVLPNPPQSGKPKVERERPLQEVYLDDLL